MEEGVEVDESEKTVVYHKGKKLEILRFTMNQISHYIHNIKYELKDFSKFTTPKEVLEYYYNKEKESVGYMEINFKSIEDFQEFFINLAKEIALEKYDSNQQISAIKIQIDSGIKKLINEFKNDEKLNIKDLPGKYYEHFRTSKIPTFIDTKIREEIQNNLLVKNLNKINIKQKFKEIGKYEVLLIYFTKILTGETKPFEIGDKSVLFNIFLYSNLKDIYKNQKIKDIISGNYYEISRCFMNNWENIGEFESEINNKKGIGYIDDKLTKTFKQYEINDSHIYTLASYFYLILNAMNDINSKDSTQYKNKNIAINNPYLNKILKNVLNSFFVYCPHERFDFNTYINLINYFNNYIIVNGVGEKENKTYDFTNIENMIRKSNLSKINEHFYALKQRMFKEDKKTFTKKLASIFNTEEFNNSIINLIPLVRNRHSNTITILISGFLSQKDDINGWELFFNYDRNNSNYYLFRGPSSDISTLIIKSLAFIFNAAKLFIECKNKAKFAGKILALILASNEEFNNCQINLVGFSLGCQVTKYCIKELEEIKGHRVMINNVCFLAGATVMHEEKKSKWRNIFRKNVAGRVINCYSKYDWVLENLFKFAVNKNAIGLNKMNLKDENGEYDVVEDYDLSDLKLGHTEYRANFDKILGRISFLNSS